MGRWFVNQGDALRANLLSSLAVNISVYVTILTPDGEFRRVRSNVPFTTNGTRVAETAVTLISTLPEGEVLSLNVATFTANVKRGQCFVQVYVIEQPTMAQGYVFANRDVVLDEHTDPGPSGGSGFLRAIGIGQPAAGVEFTTQTVPANTQWRVRSFAGTLVAAAVAVNRKPSLNYTETGGAVYARGAAGGVAGTGQTVQFAGGLGQAPTDVNDTAALAGDQICFGLPDVIMQAAETLVFVTLNLQGTDDWGQGIIEVEEWLVL